MKRKRFALDSIDGLNMANCGGLHNNCENTSLKHFKQVWQKSLTEKEELHYDHPPVEKLCYYLLSSSYKIL
jgi:hypothetical protein